MENQAAAPVTAAPTVVTDNPYGLAALWQTGDIIARSVLVLLLIMSLASWYVILTKLWDQAKLKKSAKIVEKQFWTAPSIKDGVERLKKGDEFRGIAEDGLRASSHHDGRLTDRIDLNEWITMSLQRAADGVSTKMQSGLGLLATVGSTAPFVGLFGTVAGILKAFQEIATQKTPGIGAVAGGISEALVTTAFGLFVAIPAVWLFNYFTNRVEAFDVEMDNSSSELIDYFIKQSNRR